MALITFIVPTIGRPTLKNTLDSIKSNTDGDWNAIVMFDGIEPTLESDDHRIQILKMEKTGTRNNAGLVRNNAIKLVTTPYVGFVDDDDIITSSYVSDLKKIDVDVVIFRMKNGSRISPSVHATDFVIYDVGISFCVKTDLFMKENIWFIPSDTEDFDLLDRYRNSGKNIHISPHVNYIVRPGDPRPNSLDDLILSKI
jgi:glycosyltransferase involved in cell wall biosynthesis